MKIRRRQNKLYELFNGRNAYRYVVVTTAFAYLFFIIFFYNIFYPWSFGLCVFDVILSIIVLSSIFLKNIFKRLYYPRFNPSSYYDFAKEKFNFGKSKSDDLKFNKAIIATRKYIDRHYSRLYDADILLSRLKNVKSNYDIFTQLPSNFVIGIVTGIISGVLTSNILNGGGLALLIFNTALYVIVDLFIITISLFMVYYSMKSFYSEYDSIIMPYEISKIKQQLSYIDDIYSNI